MTEQKQVNLDEMGLVESLKLKIEFQNQLINLVAQIQQIQANIQSTDAHIEKLEIKSTS